MRCPSISTELCLMPSSDGGSRKKPRSTLARMHGEPTQAGARVRRTMAARRRAVWQADTVRADSRKRRQGRQPIRGADDTAPLLHHQAEMRTPNPSAHPWHKHPKNHRAEAGAHRPARRELQQGGPLLVARTRGT